MYEGFTLKTKLFLISRDWSNKFIFILNQNIELVTLFIFEFLFKMLTQNKESV